MMRWRLESLPKIDFKGIGAKENFERARRRLVLESVLI